MKLAQWGGLRDVRYPVRCGGAAWAALAAGALLLVAPSPCLAYRTAADLSDFSGQERISFARTEIGLDIFAEIPPGVEAAALETVLGQAMDVWTAPSCTNLSLSYSGITDNEAAPGDGRSTIQWIADWNARKFPAIAPALTDVQYVRDEAGRWSIAEADLYLNLEADWTLSEPVNEQRSILAVVTHELGHVIGLLHPCELDGGDGAPACSASAGFGSEQMYPVYSADRTALADDDVAGLCFLYSPSCDVSSCDEGHACIDGLCQKECEDEGICPHGTRCVDERCVSGQVDCSSSDCGDSVLGDPCTSSSQCTTGTCGEGVCSGSCQGGAVCPPETTCDSDLGVCVDTLLALGDRCDSSTDCRGSYCLAEAGQSAVCSRSCAEGQPSCPAGWTCLEADGEPLCAPIRSEGGGCSMTPDSSATGVSSLALLGLLAFACSRRLRRRSEKLWP